MSYKQELLLNSTFRRITGVDYKYIFKSTPKSGNFERCWQLN